MLPANTLKFRSGDDTLSLSSMSSSLTGSTTSNQRRALQVKFVWKNTWEYMITALAFTTGPWCLWSFVEIQSDIHSFPNIYQYFFTYIFVGMPLVYMLIILGQYSQMGLLHLKYMCPIGHGIAYVCLILIILYISLNSIDMADMLMYFLTTLQEKVQWMICPSDIADRCWSGKENCKENCINDTVLLSAHWYWNKTYMDTVEVNQHKKMELIMPSLPRMISISFSIALVWLIVVFTSVTFQRKIVQYLFYFSFCSIIGLLFSIGGLPGSTRGLEYMFNIEDPNLLYNIGAWSHAVSIVMKNLCLGRACQMVFGSYMPSMDYSGIRTLVQVLTNLMVQTLLSMLTYMAIGVISYKAKIQFRHYNLVLHNADFADLNLIVIPQSIGFKYAPQFWNLIYFGMNFCLLLGNQILLQTVFVKCISDSFVNLLRYRKYIYSALCIFTVLISILLVSRVGNIQHGYLLYSLFFAFAHRDYIVGFYIFYNGMKTVMLLHIELIVMVAMSIVVLWIYGIKRLSDDLHFITGQQPTKFWKIFWIINPVILTVSVVTVDLYQHENRNTLMIVQLICYFLYTSPIPIFGCFEMFKYLKRRNLVGLFQPEEIWGPPDPDERIMRHVFNPRKEIKSRRRTETCQHKCLLGSKVLKRIIQEEERVRNGTPDHPRGSVHMVASED